MRQCRMVFLCAPIKPTLVTISIDMTVRMRRIGAPRGFADD